MRTARMLFFAVSFITFALALSKSFASETPVCEHLLDPIQAARFTKPIAGIRKYLTEERLAPGEIDRTVDAIAKEDGRGFLFKLQGLLRLYEAAYEAELGPFLAKIKRGEDVVGKFTEKLEYFEFGQKVNAPAPVLRVLENDVKVAKSALKNHLPALARDIAALEARVKEVDWTKPKKDARVVVGELVDEIKSVERQDYDLSELQLGIHELRRDLRWFLIYAQALDGLILLQQSTGKTKLSEYSYLETHSLASSPFSKIEPNPRVKAPVALPSRYYLALSKVVNELGAIKNSGENLHALASAFRRSGVAKSAHSAHKLASELASKDPKYVADVYERAHQLGKELERTKLLKRIRKALTRDFE